jgi:hypothetical protein
MIVIQVIGREGGRALDEQGRHVVSHERLRVWRGFLDRDPCSLGVEIVCVNLRRNLGMQYESERQLCPNFCDLFIQL